MLTLPFKDDETHLPALTVQASPGSAPNYPVELYRLYLAVFDEAAVELEGQNIKLKRGELLTLSPGEFVSFEPGGVFQSISFHHNFFCVRVMRDEVYCDGVVFNRLAGLPVVVFPETELPLLESRLHELSTVVEEQGPFSYDRAVNVLRSFLLHAADFKLRAAKVASEDDKPSAQLSSLVIAFQHLVEENFTKHKEVKFYSDALKVSPVTLNRKIKSELGQTVMQAVNDRLAIEARVALRCGKRSVKEVALDLGFVDPLYFSRFFSKHFGSPPSKYFLQPTERIE